VCRGEACLAPCASRAAHPVAKGDSPVAQGDSQRRGREPVEGPAHPEPKPGVSRDSSRRVDVIAANLPYGRTADWERLPPEIRDHEPRGGLDGGPDGLRLIERLLRAAPPYLKPGAALFVEIGDEHGQAALLIAEEAFPDARIEVKPDLAGLDRVLVVIT